MKMGILIEPRNISDWQQVEPLVDSMSADWTIPLVSVKLSPSVVADWRHRASGPAVTHASIQFAPGEDEPILVLGIGGVPATERFRADAPKTFWFTKKEKEKEEDVNESFEITDIFAGDARNQLANASLRNNDALLGWISRSTSWLDQVRNQWVPGTPLPARPAPPAERVKVTVDYQARVITTEYGPELVADPTLKIPDPPPPLPQGVAERGAKIGYKMWGCGPNDTMPFNRVEPGQPESGPTVTFDGKLHRKVGYESPWAKDGVTVFYREMT